MLTPVKAEVASHDFEQHEWQRVACMLAERYFRLMLVGAVDELRRRQREDPKGKKGFSWPDHDWDDLASTSQSILKDAVRRRAGIDDSLAGTHVVLYDRFPGLVEEIGEMFEAAGGKFEEVPLC